MGRRCRRDPLVLRFQRPELLALDGGGLLLPHAPAEPLDLGRHLVCDDIHVLFLATANETSHIHPTLLDRMDPVELEGYTVHEKTEIARTHLMGRLRADHGLPGAPALDDAALLLIIDGHTREAGVRQLRRALASIFRARSLDLVRSHGDGAPSPDAVDATPEPAGAREPVAAPPPITVDEVAAVLGPPRHAVSTLLDVLPVGVATGLSVGPAGGSILFIEIGLMPGKGRLAAATTRSPAGGRGAVASLNWL
jgi:ATP-dependent Lon protease